MHFNLALDSASTTFTGLSGRRVTLIYRENFAVFEGLYECPVCGFQYELGDRVKHEDNCKANRFQLATEIIYVFGAIAVERIKKHGYTFWGPRELKLEKLVELGIAV